MYQKRRWFLLSYNNVFKVMSFNRAWWILFWVHQAYLGSILWGVCLQMGRLDQLTERMEIRLSMSNVLSGLKCFIIISSTTWEAKILSLIDGKCFLWNLLTFCQLSFHCLCRQRRCSYHCHRHHNQTPEVRHVDNRYQLELKKNTCIYYDSFFTQSNVVQFISCNIEINSIYTFN